MIVAEPVAIPVTRPADDTVATDALDELQVTLAPFIVTPFWSLTVAESCCVAPIDEKLRLVGESVTDAATCDTVAVAVWFTEPDVAVIVAEPSATEVTRPADDTVATDAADVVHETVAPLITVPSASFTVAASVAVSESDANDRLVGESVIVAAV